MMMHWEPTSRIRRTQSRPTPRRRASALLLVVTVLGILFVTGVAFLTTINFESQMLNVEQRSKTDEIGVENVADVVNEALRNTWVAKPGVPGGAAPLGEPVQITPVQNQTGVGGGNPPVWSAFRPDALTYVEVPGVHGLFSQIEPTPTVIAGETVMTYDWFTDLKSLRSDPTAGMIYGNKRKIDTSVGNLSVLDTYVLPDGSTDPDAPLVVDADGDGLVDSILVDVTEIGVNPRDAQALGRVVNPPNSPGDRALVGLRIVPHGGMVNLAEGHPNLISAVFPGYPTPWFAKFWSERSGAYNPMVEERALRNRGGVLPARLMTATALQGNPYDTTDQDLPGGGDFAAWLFPQNESVMPGRHRFMPYATPAINSSDYLEWFDRMDPESEAYDRRHLVTTISHDNLLARPSRILLPNPSGGFSHADAFERMKEANRIVVAANNANNDACRVPDDGLPFEYPNYPHDILNGTGSGEWCDCVGTALNGGTCSIDPRKGRLRLSLEWLDAAYVPGTGATDNDPTTIGELQRIRLIQDAFTMMLLNAREPNWGTWDVNVNVWRHTVDGLKEISRVAASLTANMLDFADADGIPTPVQLRSADYTNANAFGTPVLNEFVFGVEHLQPYITEIAACVPDREPGGENPGDGVADPDSWWALEIYNPTSIRLPSSQQREAGSRFYIQVGSSGTPIQLDDITGGNHYVLVSRDGVVGNRGSAVVKIDGSFSFVNGDQIYLLQLVKSGSTGLPSDRYVVVDQFHAKGGKIAKVVRGGPAEVLDRERAFNRHPSMTQATTGDWFVPIPAEDVDRTEESLGKPNIKEDLSLKPVQVLMANNCTGPTNRTPLSNAFPTTGALHLLLRDANRSIEQAKSRTGGTVDDDKLAFTTFLYEGRTEVDNGRMPIFDTANKHRVDPGKNPAAWDSSANQYIDLPPNAPGDIEHLPWGQLISDYFTVLPLGTPSRDLVWGNPDLVPDAAFWVAQQSMGPRVDRNGLRVHGRIDLNAAPWTVLAGLPLMPMAEFEKGKVVGAAGQPLIRQAIRKALGLVRPNVPNQLQPNRVMPTPMTPEKQLEMPTAVNSDVLVWDTTAASLGEQRARAIVAYRELREIQNGPNTTGNYEYSAGTPNHYARGWNVEDPPGIPGFPGVRKLPTVRAGTGFLTVGELANVRHPSATRAGSASPITNFPEFSYYRMDGGVVGNPTMQEDYLSAVAFLVALGDWATVRSDVYTVYGTIWGQPYDDGNPTTNDDAALMERALRFQQTTDRNPAFMGQGPAQLGERMMTKYTNVNTD